MKMFRMMDLSLGSKDLLDDFDRFRFDACGQFAFFDEWDEFLFADIFCDGEPDRPRADTVAICTSDPYLGSRYEVKGLLQMIFADTQINQRGKHHVATHAEDRIEIENLHSRLIVEAM